MKKTFRSVSETSVRAKRSQLRYFYYEMTSISNSTLARIWNRLLGIENAGYVVSELEPKQVILTKRPIKSGVTVEVVIILKHTYSETVAKLIVQERRLRN